VAAAVELNAELVDEPALLGAGEAHRQENEVSVVGRLGAGDRYELRAAFDGLHLDANRLQPADVALAVVEEPDGADRVFPDTALLVGRGDLEGVPPLRPGVAGQAV